MNSAAEAARLSLYGLESPFPMAACRMQSIRGERDILRAWPRIAKLRGDAGGVSDADAIQQFFCVSRFLNCSPLIVAVCSGGDLIGAVYAGEPRIWGLPVGVVAVGHTSKAQTVVAPDPHTVPVFAGALVHLVRSRRYHTIYVQDRSLGPDRLAEVLNSVPGISYRAETVEIRQTLALADSFESFRSALGRHTRRNLMYYRRRAASAGIEFRGGLSSREITSALSHLAARQRTSRYSSRQLNLNRRNLDRMPGPFWYGLRNSAGAWLSIIGGFQCGATAYLTLQLNDGDAACDHLSISVVARSYLVEELIRVGARKLEFQGGCQGLLERHCVKERWHCVVIEKDAWAATAIRTIGRKMLEAWAVWR